MFKGVVVAMVTPYKGGEVDYDALKWLAQALVSKGVDGLFVAGTTGEWPLLSIEERTRMYEAVAEAVGGKAFILGSVMGLSPRETLENASRLRDSSVSGVVVTPPLYYRPSSEWLARHIVDVAEKAEKPVVFYTIPSNIGYNVAVEAIARAAQEHSLVAGVKATVEDMHYLYQLVIEVKTVRPDFAVLAGYGEYMLPGLIAGGDGAVDALANIVPGLLKSIYASWAEGRVAEAVRLHRALIRLSASTRNLAPLPSALKTILASLGAPLHPSSRPPLGPVDPVKTATLRTILCTAYRDYLPVADKCP